MIASLLAGFGLGLSLIVAIGAQNLFVLRQGIRRDHALVVAAVCALSDAVLIVVGVSGLGALLQALPWLIDAVRWAGALFLAGYAALAARRALRPSGAALRADDPAPAARTRLGPVVLTCLALTWLNPHVYLDTVFLLGSVAATHGDGRWWFAAGAAVASVAWFFALAVGARGLGRWLATPRAWRILDGLIAVVMLAIAISLVLPR
ncbi:LysE/ArgO family amino acid transporter [Microbacterium sp.]|uniref:LysE/ArgO family amino acid transporter n=1 Tax=Microbacterium sp. TaxID=51671 RepID=UPI0039E500C0